MTSYFSARGDKPFVAVQAVVSGSPYRVAGAVTLPPQRDYTKFNELLYAILKREAALGTLARCTEHEDCRADIELAVHCNGLRERA